MPINRQLTSQQDIYIAIRQLDDEISTLKTQLANLQSKAGILKSAISNGSGGSGNGSGGGGGSSNITFAGDLSGNDNTQTVVGLQGKPISSTAPSTNQLLNFNGTSWIPSSDLNLPGNLTINGGAIFNQGFVAHPAASITNADASSRILLDFDASNNPQIDVNGGDGNLHIADPVIVNGSITATNMNIIGSNCTQDSAGHKACFYIDPNWVTNYYFPSFNASGGAQASFVFHDNVLANGSVYAYGNNITVKESNNSGVQSLTFIAKDPNNSNLPSLTPAIAGQQLQQLNLGLYLKGNPGTLTTDGAAVLNSTLTVKQGTFTTGISNAAGTYLDSSGIAIRALAGCAFQVFSPDNSQNSSFRFSSGQPLFSSTTGWIQTDCNWNFGGPAGNQAIFGANVPVSIQNALTVSGTTTLNSEVVHANNTGDNFKDPTNGWYAYRFISGTGGNFNFQYQGSSGAGWNTSWNCSPTGLISFPNAAGVNYTGPITGPNYINIQSAYALRCWDSTNTKYTQLYTDVNGNGNITGNSGTTLIVQNLQANGNVTVSGGNLDHTGAGNIRALAGSGIYSYSPDNSKFAIIATDNSSTCTFSNATLYSFTANCRILAGSSWFFYNPANSQYATIGVDGNSNLNIGTSISGGSTIFNSQQVWGGAVNANSQNLSNVNNITCAGIVAGGNVNSFGGWGIKTTGIDATNVFGWLWNGSVNCYVNNSNVGKIQMQASERQAKENVKPFERSLEVIRELNPCSWTYKGFWKGRGDTHYGLMADDAEKVLPEMVTHEKTRIEPEDEEEKDVRFLNPYVLIYVLLNAVKELDRKLSLKGV